MRQIFLFLCFVVFPILGLAAGCGESHTIQQENATMRGDYGGNNFGGASPSAPKPMIFAASAAGDMVSGDSAKEVGLQETFAEPSDFTVEFGILPVDTGDYNPIRAEAQITFIIKGVSIQRVVSIGNGSTITGVCESIIVKIVDRTLPLGAPLVSGQRYKATASVARGTRGTDTLPPTLLRPFNSNRNIITVGASSSYDLNIPQNCGIKSVLVQVLSGGVPIPDQAVEVSQFTGSTHEYITGYDPRSIGFCPVFPGATGLQLLNYNAFDVTFAILWGIDG